MFCTRKVGVLVKCWCQTQRHFETTTNSIVYSGQQSEVSRCFFFFFMVGLSIPDSRIRCVIVVAPSLFSYSVENSSKPTVRHLVEEDGNSNMI